MTIDFKLILKDKVGYNNMFIVIDYLSKQAVFTPYYKTVTIEDIA
jgi:hypothetical protein